MEKVLVIVGPTATGKSALAISLGRRFDGEIISADSRQIYRGLDIGSGKVSRREMRGIPHHLLDVADPKRQCSVAEYQSLGREAMEDILRRKKLPIIVGGTGLYVQALTNDVLLPEVPPNTRLRKQLAKKSATHLFAMLRRLDPKRAKSIDPHNPRRLVRAIEITKTLGKVPPYENSPRTDIDVLFIGLHLPSVDLRKKIALRLAARMKAGMVREAKRLHANGLTWKRLDELGLEYRYLAKFLKKEMTKDEMTRTLEAEIWKYAKRQMTWFKRNKRIIWFSPKEIERIEKKVKRFLQTDPYTRRKS